MMIVNYEPIKLQRDRFMQYCEFDTWIVGMEYTSESTKVPMYKYTNPNQRIDGVIIGTKSFRAGRYVPGDLIQGTLVNTFGPASLEVDGSINCYKVLTGFNKVYYVPQDQVYTNFFIDATDE